MSPCPPPEQLEQLLAENLTDPDHTTVEAHVESCAACQERLHLLVGNPLTAVSPRGPRHRAESVPEPDDEFLRRLRQTPLPHLMAARDRTSSRPPAPQAPSHTEALTQDATDPPGLERLGPYELLEKLGTGGMGVVYKARHRELAKVVALKVLPAERMNEMTIARFKNEMRAVGKLEHPNIVGAHDAGQLGGTHFLVMEFVDGIDLDRLVERQGGLRLADACELICQAAAGLQHAHDRGLVHRDIKPSNLMLARTGLVKVLDLGVARSLGDAPAGERLTATGMILGTADYLAPEQWEASQTADIRADIYSLGCTLYHLLAGTPPFGGARYSSWRLKMRAHLETPVPPLRLGPPEAPAELLAVLERMLAKNPADRFATPAEVAAALQPFTAGADLARFIEPGGAYPEQVKVATRTDSSTDPAQPIQQTPPQATRRGRFLDLVARRYRLIATLAGCGLLLAAALVLWPGGWRSPPPDQPLQILAMHFHHFRGPEANYLGEMGITSATTRLDDDVRVAVRLSTPAYCYLIAFNPDGTEQLCYPEERDAERARAVPPARSADLRFPQQETGYFGLDAVGLQAFVLVASTRPLPPYADWRSQIGPIPWQSARAAGVWRFDGQEVVQLPRERGTVRQRRGPPQPLLDLCRFFKDRPEFEVVQILAFPVTND
jgi:serine/threonine protein kinase